MKKREKLLFKTTLVECFILGVEGIAFEVLNETIDVSFGKRRFNHDKRSFTNLKRTENMLDIMNTRDYNELTEEIKRQEEFLNALKEFRKNL